MDIPTESRLVRVRLVRDLRGIWGVPATRTDKTDPSDIIGIDWSGAELERHPIEEFRLGDVDRNGEGSTFIDWAAAGVFSQG